MVSHGPAVARNAQELLSEFVTTGRQEPFEEIVRRYAGMVFNVCLQILKDTHDAEDACQAVFLTLAVQAKTANGVKYIGPWLQRVAQRLSLDIKRSKTRRKAREERHSALTIARNGDNFPDHGRQLDMDELKTVLRDELDRLPAKYRLPLILHYFGGLKPEEMARELGCKPSTLGVRLHRGRKMLADNLADRGMAVSGTILGVALAACIQSTVTEHLIHSTGHAAVQLAAGHPIGATLSPQVLSFNRMASTGLTIARIKAAITAGILIAGAAAGAAQVVTRTHILDSGFGITSELRSWLAPIFRAFNRPLRADAGAVEQAPKVEVTLANELTPISEKSLLSDPWLNMSRPAIDAHDDQFLVARATAGGLGTISISTPSSSSAAQSIAAIPPTFVFAPPRNDSATHLPALSQAFSSASTGPSSSSSSSSSYVLPVAGPISVDSVTYGAARGESMSLQFDQPTTYTAREMVVGDHGNANIAQTAGKVNVGEKLVLGNSSDGSGTYTLSGNSELHATNIEVGGAGAGRVVQNEPAVASADAVAIGKTGTGVYDLHGGTLQTKQLDVGVKGTGKFNQTGGSAQSHGVHVAVDRGSTGTVNLNDGTLAAQDQVVGNVGDGRFVQTGGTNRTSSLKLGSSDSGVGGYELTGGTIEVQRINLPSAPPAQIVVGTSAKGTFQLGDKTSTGTITESGDGAPASLIVRGKRSARGTFLGWGEVKLSGKVDESGRIIADGFGANRTLDLSAAGEVTNTIDNPPDGSNGWYARNGGKLMLPPMHVHSGTHSYTWGESAQDGQPDLVNSLRVTLHDVTEPCTASIALAAPDRGDVPLAPLGYKLLSVWQTNIDASDTNSMDLLVRYDASSVDPFAADAGSVQLWTYSGDHWELAAGDSTSIDSENHLLYATGLSPAPIFAIAAPDFAAISVPTPEPGCVLALAAAAGALLARRRRNVN